MNVSAYRGMTATQFMGTPKIVEDRPSSLFVDGMPALSFVPFMAGKYRARFTPRQIVVYDGSTPIASYWGGRHSTIFVVPSHRRQGIALELMYQRALRYGPLIARARTSEMQAIAVKVWDRIQKELAT